MVECPDVDILMIHCVGIFSVIITSNLSFFVTGQRSWLFTGRTLPTVYLLLVFVLWMSLLFKFFIKNTKNDCDRFFCWELREVLKIFLIALKEPSECSALMLHNYRERPKKCKLN
ncbi:hypothetical protein TELCIR_26129 [Teladorsagia circumcincta]|uniref:Uncharacterized protein n=1 Tax=Teladorsagia circumcincta TaxID=45464 RepID=A0A2G9T3N7_TELCI|nr:hypothetical protein TELCIR_26129 [Teladorsagia circumcincta]